MSDLAKIVDDLSKLTVLEAAELAKLLEILSEQRLQSLKQLAAFQLHRRNL